MTGVEERIISRRVRAARAAGLMLAALACPACARPLAAPLEVPFDFKTRQPRRG
jgi:hypothetical protein